MLLTRREALNEVNFKQRGKVGVKRTSIVAEAVKDDAPISNVPDNARNDYIAVSSDLGYKVLQYQQFSQVLKRMQAEADVALQIQIAERCITCVR